MTRNNRLGLAERLNCSMPRGTYHTCAVEPATSLCNSKDAAGVPVRTVMGCVLLYDLIGHGAELGCTAEKASIPETWLPFGLVFGVRGALRGTICIGTPPAAQQLGRRGAG